MYQVKTPTLEHIIELSATMREDDRLECLLATGSSPDLSLLMSLAISTFKEVLLVDNKVICIAGVCDDYGGDGGAIWLLGSDLVFKHKKAFWKFCKNFHGDMKDQYNLLYNYVYIENKMSLRLIKKLGFTIDEPTPYGLGQELFHKIHWRK